MHILYASTYIRRAAQPTSSAAASSPLEALIRAQHDSARLPRRHAASRAASTFVPKANRLAAVRSVPTLALQSKMTHLAKRLTSLVRNSESQALTHRGITHRLLSAILNLRSVQWSSSRFGTSAWTRTLSLAGGPPIYLAGPWILVRGPGSRRMIDLPRGFPIHGKVHGASARASTQG